MIATVLRRVMVLRLSSRRAAALAIVSLFGALGACETQQQRVAAREDKLSAAGFVIRPANTAEREAMLARLPANKFVRRASGDSVHYVYADPLVCGCLYVGTQEAYNRYKALQQTQHLADEQLLTAQTYSDAAWSWGAWGPLDPSFGYYGAVGW